MAQQNPIDEAKELQSMLVQYAKQETVGPLRSLGQYIAWGLAGAVLVFLGVVFVGIGVLRLMQSETGDTFDGFGGLSLVPYLVAIVVMVAIAGLIARSMFKAARAVR